MLLSTSTTLLLSRSFLLATPLKKTLQNSFMFVDRLNTVKIVITFGNVIKIDSFCVCFSFFCCCLFSVCVDNFYRTCKHSHLKKILLYHSSGFILSLLLLHTQRSEWCNYNIYSLNHTIVILFPFPKNPNTGFYSGNGAKRRCRLSLPSVMWWGLLLL